MRRLLLKPCVAEARSMTENRPRVAGKPLALYLSGGASILGSGRGADESWTHGRMVASNGSPPEAFHRTAERQSEHTCELCGERCEARCARRDGSSAGREELLLCYEDEAEPAKW